MASNIHCSSNITFSSEALGITSYHSCLEMCCNNSRTMPTISATESFDKQFWVPDLLVQDINSCEFPWSATQGLSAAKYQPEMMNEFGEESNGFVSNFSPVYSMASDHNWEIQAKLEQKMEEPTAKVGRYSVEERKEKIMKYLKKRNQRNFNKTIKYACRKTLADRRVRVRGRFAKNNENTSEDETPLMKANDSPCEAKDLYYDGSLQINQDEEEWLQEAIANLLHVPYVEY